MRYAFIRSEEDRYPLTVLCRVMRVSRSGYYAFVRRPPSQRARQETQLRVHVRAAFAASQRRYGSPRVHAQLRAQGLRTSRKRVARLMRQQQLVARKRRRHCKTTDSRHSLPVAPNHVHRNFSAQAPNQLWCGDITYLRTRSGFLYLAVLLDMFSRAVVGFAVGPQLDRSLVLQALREALRRRRVRPGLLHHTDRGSQYASDDYQRELKQHGLVCSMSRAGDCYDNAPSESFFSTLKAECHTDDLAPEQVAAVIHQYICGFYNPVRKHSSLGYVSPMQFERQSRARSRSNQAPSST